MRGQMAHDTMGVAGGGGILIGLIVFAGLFIICILFSLVKIAVFAFCAVTLVNGIKNPKENCSLKRLALLLLCVPLGILSGYLLLIDLNPVFLNVFANADPSICELHASPIFYLNPLRFEDTMSMGYYGTAYYDGCMRQNSRFGKDLEFCNEIKHEKILGGGDRTTDDCIGAAVAAGARNCEAMDTGYYYNICSQKVDRTRVSPEGCEEIEDQTYRNKCFYKIATNMEDCESVSGVWNDVCIKDFASVREECDRIVTSSVKYECYANFASLMEDCEAIPEGERGPCINKVATNMEDCEKIVETKLLAECISRVATKPEDCEVINETGMYGPWECMEGLDKKSRGVFSSP